MKTLLSDRPDELLAAAYEQLGYSSGSLVATSAHPQPDQAPSEWRDFGEWLILGERMGAERVFFVGDDPVVLFTSVLGEPDDAKIVDAYRRAWSLGRARCLFLAMDGELRVYALTTPPPRSLDERQSLTPLKIVTRAADIAEALADYHRESLESGALFTQAPFRGDAGRADKRFLRDVRAATDALVSNGLGRSLAHALIERVILVRYLEDRGVIGSDYFEEVAARQPAWQLATESPFESPSLGAQSIFISFLSSKDLTYALFEKLEASFNGDMFIVSPEEAATITTSHLILIQRLLTGSGVSGQEPLFLWAYDFSVVPTSLISSMYEQFYGAGSDDDTGTHYTPQELVEYVVTQTLTPAVLNKRPSVCDPACGSGIFLVEAFRRIVRHEMTRRRRPLSSQDLKSLLLERIAGIDINPEAVRLAAFSLYLAYLNYQEPRDITAAGPLPKLVASSSAESDHAVLTMADAFSPLRDEYPAVSHDSETLSLGLPWLQQSFDIVIGNPPWDEPKRAAYTQADLWAEKRGYKVGDRSRSQLFMWRALSLVKPKGRVAFLVAAGVFHNVRSRDFRQQWLEIVKVDGIVNFSSVRRIFFSQAISPFDLIIYSPRADQEGTGAVLYRTVRPSSPLEVTRSMPYASTERRWVEQEKLRRHDYLWKTYAWGNHHDAALMGRLAMESRLAETIPAEPGSAWGYQYGDEPPSPRLAALPSLRDFEPWGPIRDEWFEAPPEGVKRQPDEARYSGQRILVKRGVRAGFGPAARLLTEDCSFRHTIYCLPLPGVPSWQAQTLLGIVLSSLGRYVLFMRSSHWGLWHDQITADDILNLPVRLNAENDPNIERIVTATSRLPSWTPERRARSPLQELDNAVFDLFELSAAERDLVTDFHSYSLDIAGRWKGSLGLSAVPPPTITTGRRDDLDQLNEGPLKEYLDKFLGMWNNALNPEGEFSWRIVSSPRIHFTGAIFETVAPDSDAPIDGSDEEWRGALNRLEAALHDRNTHSMTSESVLRSVTDTSIVVIKRSDTRLWTATSGREDAEATILQAMKLEQA